MEAFELFRLNCDWTLELSGGARYNEFFEAMDDVNDTIRTNAFHGLGGIVAAEAKRDVLIGSVYGGLRAALLFGESNRFNDDTGTEDFVDVNRTQLELGLGWELDHRSPNGSIFFVRAGVEYQTWFDFSSAFEEDDEDEWVGRSNVGFAGFVAGAGVTY